MIYIYIFTSVYIKHFSVSSKVININEYSSYKKLLCHSSRIKEYFTAKKGDKWRNLWWVKMMKVTVEGSSISVKNLSSSWRRRSMKFYLLATINPCHSWNDSSCSCLHRALTIWSQSIVSHKLERDSWCATVNPSALVVVTNCRELLRVEDTVSNGVVTEK